MITGNECVRVLGAKRVASLGPATAVPVSPILSALEGSRLELAHLPDARTHVESRLSGILPPVAPPVGQSTGPEVSTPVRADVHGLVDRLVGGLASARERLPSRLDRLEV